MVKCDRCLRVFKAKDFDMAAHQQKKYCKDAAAKLQPLVPKEDKPVVAPQCNNTRQALLDKYKELPEIESFLQNELDEGSLNTLQVTVGLGFYDRTEFVIDLDKIWKIIGFVQKKTAVKSLRNSDFVYEKDYICLVDDLHLTVQGLNQVKEMGKEVKTLMTTTCAQLLASRAKTEKGPMIARHYVNIVNCMSDYIYLKAELAQRPAIADIERARDKAILSTVHDLYLDDDVIYILDIGSHDFTQSGETIKEQLAKLGISDGVANRVEQHMKTFGFCDIKYIYRTKNRVKVERDYKEANKARRRTLKINGVNHTELFVVDKHYTFESILQEIKDIDAKYADDEDRAHKRTIELKRLELEVEEKKQANKKSDQEHQLAILHAQREMAKLEHDRAIELKRLEQEYKLAMAKMEHELALKRIDKDLEKLSLEGISSSHLSTPAVSYGNKPISTDTFTIVPSHSSPGTSPVNIPTKRPVKDYFANVPKYDINTWNPDDLCL